MIFVLSTTKTWHNQKIGSVEENKILICLQMIIINYLKININLNEFYNSFFLKLNHSNIFDPDKCEQYIYNTCIYILSDSYFLSYVPSYILEYLSFVFSVLVIYYCTNKSRCQQHQLSLSVLLILYMAGHHTTFTKSQKY